MAPRDWSHSSSGSSSTWSVAGGGGFLGSGANAGVEAVRETQHSHGRWREYDPQSTRPGSPVARPAQGPSPGGTSPCYVCAMGFLVSWTILVSWLSVSLGLWVADKFLKDFRIEGGIGSYLLLGAVVGALHLLLGWFLFGVLVVVTLGIGYLVNFITRLVVTAIVLKLADALSQRFTIRGFLPAFYAAALMSLVSMGVDWVLRG